MKKIIMAGLLIIGALAYGRDYEYNEMRDIVKPMQESMKMQNMNRMSRYNEDALNLQQNAKEANEKGQEFILLNLERTDNNDRSQR